MADLIKPDFDTVGEDENVVDEPKWLEYKPVANFCNENTFYCDIVNHYHERLSYDSLMTISHEACHMIHSDLRQKHEGKPALYIGGNKYIFFSNPKMTKDRIAQFVPDDLRGSRFQLYIAGSKDWSDFPNYVLDEAQAYITGFTVGVELVESGKYREGNTDYIMSIIEFSIYALALVHAIDKFDKPYYEREPEFIKYIGWFLRRSRSLYNKGVLMKEFSWTNMDKYVLKFQQSIFKDTLKTRFGGVWL